MKLTKNEIQDLAKAGLKAIEVKLDELRLTLASEALQLSRGELKDLHAPKSTRRAIAKLKTLRSQMQLIAKKPQADTKKTK